MNSDYSFDREKVMEAEEFLADYHIDVEDAPNILHNLCMILVGTSPYAEFDTPNSALYGV